MEYSSNAGSYFLLTFVSNYFIYAIILWILLVVANWKIFEKCGEKGWKALIPIYSNYMEFKLFWGNTVYFWIAIICGLLNVIPVLGAIGDIVALVINALLVYKKAQSFGEGIGFALGLYFLGNIFTLLLAFGHYTYQGIPRRTEFEETVEGKVNDVFNKSNDDIYENHYDNTPDDNIIDAEFTEKKDDTEDKGE